MPTGPLLRVARQDHHPRWRERLTDPTRLAEDATPMLTMVHRQRVIAGKAAYAMRKQPVKPVPGINRSAM
ncbi:MAG TPA: hypothetical protein PLB25_01725 [Rhodoferax sp.]|nr:hypothetical protein [Rhodoferax sp.]